MKKRHYVALLFVACLVWGFIEIHPEHASRSELQFLVKEKRDCSSDLFNGTDRREAKTSLASAHLERFNSLDSFLVTLVSDSIMRLNQQIKRSPENQRVEEENRNVALTNVYLYAIKREDDNDFHLIIGNKDSVFFNVEISGLPDESKASYHRILKTRKQLEKQFGILCNSSYKKFIPALAIELEGSLFFDIDHKAGVVGPKGYKPKTAWEIHPVSNIVFQ